MPCREETVIVRMASRRSLSCGHYTGAVNALPAMGPLMSKIIHSRP